MNTLAQITQMLTEIGNVKAASSLIGTDAVQAEQDPGGRLGQTTHPSKSVDNGTSPARLGARAAENETDVKQDQPVGVDRTSPGGGGSQDSRQLNIGMRQSATGEDPTTEDRYKGRPTDPGTTAPADTEIGEKYASMSFDALTKLAYAKFNSVLAALTATTDKTAAPVQLSSEVEAAQRAGYELANLVLSQPAAETVKAATHDVVAQTLRDAIASADAVGRYVRDYYAAKQAMMAGAEEMPPTPGDGSEGLPTGPGEEMGGALPMPAGGGGMPEGGMPEGDMGGSEGGGGHEEAVEALVNSLIEAGISPDELAQAIASEGDGEGGMGGGMGGGMPTKEAQALTPQERRHFQGLVKIASRLWTPRFRFKAAQPGTPARKARDEMVQYLKDVCGR